jgi:[ribosomal protein S5]-alanine N-acetyltransferase
MVDASQAALLRHLDRLPDIGGERVRLRWLTHEDAQALFGIFGDPEVMRYWSHEPFEDASEAHAYIDSIHDHFRRHSLYQWGIEAAETREVIGTCTLAALDVSHARAELGYALSRRWWRCGVMREILPKLIAFAFRPFGGLNLRRLTADVDPRNVASLRLLEHLGFQQEGLLRAHYCVGGEIQDAAIYGLLRDGGLERQTR